MPWGRCALERVERRREGLHLEVAEGRLQGERTNSSGGTEIAEKGQNLKRLGVSLKVKFLPGCSEFD